MGTMWADARQRRVLLTSYRGEHLLEGVISAPVAWVPNYHTDRSEAARVRIIWDAGVLNAGCGKEAPLPRYNRGTRTLRV